MWGKIKEAAIALLGQQSVTFAETPETLVGEAVSVAGLADPAMMEFLEVIHDNMPKGCDFSLYNRKPRVVFIAGVSRDAILEVEQVHGLRIAA